MHAQNSITIEPNQPAATETPESPEKSDKAERVDKSETDQVARGDRSDSPANPSASDEDAKQDGCDQAATKASADNGKTDETSDGAAAMVAQAENGANAGCSSGQDNDDDKGAQSDDDDGQRDLVAELQPWMDNSLTSYSDSERFHTLTATSVFNFSLFDNEMSLRKDFVTASDPTGREEFDSEVVTIHHDLSELFSLGGGLGIARTQRWSDYVGSIKGEANLWGLSFEGGVARDLIATTANEIRHNLHQTDYALGISGNLWQNLSASLELHRRTYSDGNSAREFEFTPQYSFDFAGGKAALGYDFNYQSFARDSEFYWTPHDLISHNAALTWAFNSENTYGKIMAAAGHATAGPSPGVAQGPSSGYDAVGSAVVGLRYGTKGFAEVFSNVTETAQWNSKSIGLRIGFGL